MDVKREKVVSGIRSTGNLHLGNYFGAMKNFVQMQHEHDCYFFIANYHALTTHPNPTEIYKNSRTVLAEYLACGIDPEKSTIYLQSDLRQTAELYLLLSMHAYLGELERSTSFKDKVRKNPDNVNAGLLTYPVLMAADILIHKATKVPVGKDQEQHLEMARNFANRFNHFYGTETFPEPYPFSFTGKLVKVPGLDGTGKMGKSEGEHNALFLSDDDATLKKKIMRAVTDAGPTEPNTPVSEPVENLFKIMELVSKGDVVTHFRNAYADCSIRYGDLKKQLLADVIEFVSPIRSKIIDLKGNENYLNKVMKRGAEMAQENGEKTLLEVREIMGLKSY